MRSEFQFIQSIKDRYGLKHLGDDCAVLPKDDATDQLITADLLVENIDFRLDWITPELLGHKALAVSLSDIAAMGGEPSWALLSIGVPERLWNSDFVDRFYEGWHNLAKKFEVELIGGDVSRSPDGFVIDSVAGGEVASGEAVLRSGAAVGDLILVSGDLGGSAGGLALLQERIGYGAEAESWQLDLILKHLQPWPQISSALLLQLDNSASSMIDISDGLSSDLGHICQMSGVGARIFASKIPIDPNLQKLRPAFEDQLDLALNGGEDFQLLFTARMEKISRDDEQLFTVIGEVTTNKGIVEIVVGDEIRELPPKGYRHF